MAENFDHANHRSRLRSRFLNESLDNFAEHEALELLLFYAIARKDVNPLAHQLIKHFGSLAAVFDAPFEELCKVPGIGENTALLIKLIPQLSRKYAVSAASCTKVVKTIDDAADLLRPNFIGKMEEELWMLCLDGKGKVLCVRMLGSGSMNMSAVNTRRILETAINTECTCVVLAHNHPSGVAVPSQDDVETTKLLSAALITAGVALLDHLIFARGDDDYVSLKDSGYMEG